MQHVEKKENQIYPSRDIRNQVSTSSIFVMILALPPRGIVSCLPQARHFTTVLAQPKMIWELLHSVHEILRNRDLGDGSTSLSFILLHQFEFLQALGCLVGFYPAFLARDDGHAALVDLGVLVEDGFRLGSITPQLAVIPAPAL